MKLTDAEMRELMDLDAKSIYRPLCTVSRDLAEEVLRLRELLRRVTWVRPMSNSVRSCSACGSHFWPAHEPECQIEEALRDA